MNPNDLRIKKAEALAEAQRINRELSAADCDLTQEQRDKREAREVECLGVAEQCDLDIKATEARELAARERADRIKALGTEPGVTGRQTKADQPGNPLIEVKAPNFTKDPMKGFATPREYFGLVQAAGRGESRVMDDPRLKYLATAGSDEQQAGSDPYGGFLLPEAMAPGVNTIGVENDPFAGKTTPLRMEATSVKVNSLVDKDHTTSVSGGFVTARRSETAAMAASRTKMEQVKFEANSLYGFAYATEELLRDSPGTVASLLSTGFSNEFQATHIKELLRGSGVGEPEGIQNSPALITVAAETNQAADTINYQNIIKMHARLWSDSGAFWLYNKTCETQLKQLTLPIGTGGVPMWQTSLVDGAPNRLDGLPVYSCEYCEAVGDLYDILLVQPSAIYEGTYQPLESAESVHVRFLNHERAFKFWLRNDARSLWRSAVTPNKGNTLSPFVTLAARA